MIFPGFKFSSDMCPWLTDHWSFFLQRLNDKRLAHALMVTGPEGIGKMSLTSVMVARLLCIEAQSGPCGNCQSCKLLAGGAHPDCFELQPEEGSEVIKVQQVRGLISSLELTTTVSECKVAFIHPAENMNIAAANALLKSLEEPVGNTVLILVTANPGRLPITIRSRCQVISIHQPEQKLAADWLEERTGKNRAEVDAALQAAGGSPFRALGYLDSPELDAYAQVRQGLATLLIRPGTVSSISSQLNELEPVDLWRWLSMCASDAVKSTATGSPSGWLPTEVKLTGKDLLRLQHQADINRHLTATQVRGDLLLQSWLIRWAEQVL
jgi:DNA polymerase-3 subunit delta'